VHNSTETYLRGAPRSGFFGEAYRSEHRPRERGKWIILYAMTKAVVKTSPLGAGPFKAVPDAGGARVGLRATGLNPKRAACV
jgi:hypothetical protein